jgi:serine/threonine protein kinase
MTSRHVFPTNLKMSQKLWVQHQTDGNVFGPTQVSIDRCEYVDGFKEAIKNKFEIPGPSSHLTLYKPDGTTEIDVEESPSVYLNENSRRNALVVKTVATQVRSSSIPDKLKQLGVKFTMKDVNYILNSDKIGLNSLMLPSLTKDGAQAILTSAKSKIKSATQKAIGQQFSFFLDGSLNVGQGQAKSSLYYVYSESGGVLVAKVYSEHKEDFIREVKINKALEHKNLVKFINNFSIQSETRHIIIMPFFPRSVADMLTQHSSIPLAAIRVIARNCFDALCHLHSKGFCFSDLKPSNIMLQNAEHGHATLVDYGATVRIGSPIIEFTQHYCLDADTITATEHLDWICLGTTLAQIGGFDIIQLLTL